MKRYIIPLSKPKVEMIFWGFILLGLLLLLVQDVKFIVAGFAVSTFALHELGHLIALKQRGYNVVAIVISIWPPGIGPLPERPIEPEDGVVVYLSGLISIVLPIFTMYYTIEFGVLFLTGTILLSIVDIWCLWKLKKLARH